MEGRGNLSCNSPTHPGSCSAGLGVTCPCQVAGSCSMTPGWTQHRSFGDSSWRVCLYHALPTWYSTPTAGQPWSMVIDMTSASTQPQAVPLWTWTLSPTKIATRVSPPSCPLGEDREGLRALEITLFRPSARVEYTGVVLRVKLFRPFCASARVE